MVEKTHVLDELPAGLSYSTEGLEFNANEATYIVNKLSLNRITHKTRLRID